MKWINHFKIVVVFLLLSGCSERELTFERTYPDTSHLDELRENKQLQIKEEMKNLSVYMTKNNIPPRNLIVSIPNDSLYVIKAFQFCWAPTHEECENMQPKHPYEYKTEIIQAVNLNQNDVISLTPDFEQGILPFPDRIEGYYYDENNNLQFQEELTKDKDSFFLTAPAESKSFIFQFKAYYEGDVKGISYHPYRIAVK